MRNCRCSAPAHATAFRSPGMRARNGALALTAFCVWALPALGDGDVATQRSLMQRQQQADEFVLRLRQQQQRLRLIEAGELRQLQELEGTQLQQRQRLETLDDQQQRSLNTASPESEADPARLIHERERADRERQTELNLAPTFRLPPPALNRTPAR